MARLNKPSTWSHYVTLLKKDLLQEMHTREMLTSMGLYALLVLVVYGAALAQTSARIDILHMSGGLLWVVILFTSLLGLNRSFAHEREEGCLEGLLLIPMDRSVIFLAKATANVLFLLVIEIIVVPLFFFFFLGDVELAPSWPLIIPCLMVGTIGIAGIGTLLATMTSHTRGKDVMLAVLFIPLVFPLLWASVAATTCVMVGDAGYLHSFMISMTLMAGYDIIMILVSWVLYDFVIGS